MISWTIVQRLTSALLRLIRSTSVSAARSSTEDVLFSDHVVPVDRTRSVVALRGRHIRAIHVTVIGIDILKINVWVLKMIVFISS